MVFPPRTLMGLVLDAQNQNCISFGLGAIGVGDGLPVTSRIYNESVRAVLLRMYSVFFVFHNAHKTPYKLWGSRLLFECSLLPLGSPVCSSFLSHMGATIPLNEKQPCSRSFIALESHIPLSSNICAALLPVSCLLVPGRCDCLINIFVGHCRDLLWRLLI